MSTLVRSKLLVVPVLAISLSACLGGGGAASTAASSFTKGAALTAASSFTKVAPTAYKEDAYGSYSDVLLNKAESTFPNYFPEHQGTKFITDPAGNPILYRAYSNGWMTGTYWWGRRVPRVYYSQDGGATWVYYGTMEDSNMALCGGNCWTPDMKSEIDGVMSNVLNLTGDLTSGGVMDQFSVILNAVFSSSAGATCPSVVSNPPLANLNSLPATWDINVNYGSGCTAADGSKMSGSAAVRLSQLQLASAGLSTHVDATFSNLARNGVPLANGSAVGDIALAISGDSLGGNATVHVSNFLMPNGETANGDISIQPTGVLGNFNATVNTSTKITPVPGLYLDAGAQNLALTVRSQADDSLLINGTGQVDGYALQFSNLVLNPSACSSYPISGSVVFSKNGAKATVTYSPGCSGNYTYQQG